jgi:cytochrome c-type biogenesis protein
MGLLVELVTSFLLGLATPLTAVCVLPLYPGFLAYLSNRLTGEEGRKSLIMFSLIVVLGVIVFMALLGLIFTTLLKISLTEIIEIVSPIAFGILALIGVMLIFNVDFSRFLPKFTAPTSGNPLKSAFIFGFFFGAIVIPCNPGFIAAFFARAFLANDFVGSMLNFLFFGIGLGFPLLAFSVISAQWSQTVIGFLTRHKKPINIISGLIMIGVAVYYLFFVFKIFG